MKTPATFIVAALLGTSAAAPSAIEARSSIIKARGTFCEDFGSERSGNYQIFNNLWGKRDASSGSQCTTVSGANGDGIQWGSTWSWSVSNFRESISR